MRYYYITLLKCWKGKTEQKHIITKTQKKPENVSKLMIVLITYHFMFRNIRLKFNWKDRERERKGLILFTYKSWDIRSYFFRNLRFFCFCWVSEDETSKHYLGGGERRRIRFLGFRFFLHISLPWILFGCSVMLYPPEGRASAY